MDYNAITTLPALDENVKDEGIQLLNDTGNYSIIAQKSFCANGRN